jgi:hypothetical protein
MEYTCHLFADYFQLILQDEDTIVDLTNWSAEAVADMLLVSQYGFAVGTARNMTVPLTVDVRGAPADDDFAAWDHVMACHIEVPSRRLLMMGVSDAVDTALRIPVPSDSLCVRIYYGGLATLSDDGLRGDDQYRVVLWPGPRCETGVLKR